MVQGKIKVTMFCNWDYVACIYYCIYATESWLQRLKVSSIHQQLCKQNRSANETLLQNKNEHID